MQKHAYAYMVRICVCEILTYLASSVYGSADAEIGGVIELAARDFPLVASQCVDTAAIADVPYLQTVWKNR